MPTQQHACMHYPCTGTLLCLRMILSLSPSVIMRPVHCSTIAPAALQQATTSLCTKSPAVLVARAGRTHFLCRLRCLWLRTRQPASPQTSARQKLPCPTAHLWASRARCSCMRSCWTGGSRRAAGGPPAPARAPSAASSAARGCVAVHAWTECCCWAAHGQASQGPAVQTQSVRSLALTGHCIWQGSPTGRTSAQPPALRQCRAAARKQWAALRRGCCSAAKMGRRRLVSMPASYCRGRESARRLASCAGAWRMLHAQPHMQVHPTFTCSSLFLFFHSFLGLPLFLICQP